MVLLKCKSAETPFNDPSARPQTEFLCKPIQGLYLSLSLSLSLILSLSLSLNLSQNFYLSLSLSVSL